MLVSVEGGNLIAELHSQVKSVLQKLTTARAAGLPYEAYLHRVRLEDLMDAAGSCGVDVDTWVDRSQLPPLTLVEG
ncbi:hypothetical protein ACVGVM_27995 (plasmid) [Pseudonocardia bannensis]|uniref:Uncharacterized protein n=1 Tax=Pseudonocardia bannensis TaxID=630973 RepID=A0A848DIK8_9PSEU|nr:MULTISPECIES: hypothetical protein [Pseudonocardia]NMH92383.1 hypothetical protein [Pseudonocardia bannensis]